MMKASLELAPSNTDSLQKLQWNGGGVHAFDVFPLVVSLQKLWGRQWNNS